MLLNSTPKFIYIEQFFPPGKIVIEKECPLYIEINLRRIEKERCSRWNSVQNREYLLWLIFCYIITVYVGFAGVALLYTLRPPINFTPTNIGYWTSELNATKFFGATLVNYFLLHKLKWTDIRVLIIYAASMIGLSISTAFSDTSWKIFVGKLKLPHCRTAKDCFFIFYFYFEIRNNLQLFQSPNNKTTIADTFLIRLKD